jgi:hypothetical protein
MLGFKGLSTGLKFAAQMSPCFKFKTTIAVPKFNYSSTIAEIASMNSAIINPNIIHMLNLR